MFAQAMTSTSPTTTRRIISGRWNCARRFDSPFDARMSVNGSFRKLFWSSFDQSSGTVASLMVG